MLRLGSLVAPVPSAAKICGCIALFAFLVAASLPQPSNAKVSLVMDQDPAPATGPPPAATPNDRAKQPSVDPVEQRIKYLHDRLRITAAQEPLWAAVAQVMRDNAKAVAPLIKERVQTAQRGTAIDNLRAYERLGEEQLDGLKKFNAAFQALYERLSSEQKKISDSIFRIGPLSMIGGIPQPAESLVAPAPFAYYPSYAGLPPFPSYLPYPTGFYYPPYPYYYYPYYRPWILGPPYYRPLIWGPPFGTRFFIHGRHHHHDHHHTFRAPGAGGGALHHR